MIMKIRRAVWAASAAALAFAATMLWTPNAVGESPAPAFGARVVLRDARAEEFDQAAWLFRQKQWSGAFGRFSHAADQGNREAARIALFMLRNGSQLFGSEWTASQDQIDHWMRLAAHSQAPLLAEGGD
jgi:hypothetical protein